MNMLDLHTREKVNTIHIDEMHREARIRHFLQNVISPGSAIRSKARISVILTAVLLALLAATLLSSAGTYF
jgi:hypothetical protein